jgi:hypothetical protein
MVSRRVICSCEISAHLQKRSSSPASAIIHVREGRSLIGRWLERRPARHQVNVCPGVVIRDGPGQHHARNLIERFFNKIKQCRRVATRYDKLAADYLAFVKLASIRI